MNRLPDQIGLQNTANFREIAYDTEDEQWPRARVRITPVAADQDDRFYQPSADPVPPRVHVRMSASLIDDQGAVLTIGTKLLLGPESIHSWQFDADAPFDPDGWLDGCAAAMITDLLRQARGISAASAAGLIAG